MPASTRLARDRASGSVGDGGVPLPRAGRGLERGGSSPRRDLRPGRTREYNSSRGRPHRRRLPGRSRAGSRGAHL